MCVCVCVCVCVKVLLCLALWQIRHCMLFNSYSRNWMHPTKP